MSTSVDGYQNVRQCPYNPAHQILSHRFQTHLVKCKKAYPDIILKVCPFNSSHHIPEVKYQGHVQDCPDRKSLDLYAYKLDTNRNEDEQVQLYEEVTGAENWEDCNDASYDPKKNLEESGVMLNRSYSGLKPAEKKKLREQELLRSYSKLKNNEYKTSPESHRRLYTKSGRERSGPYHRRSRFDE